MLEDSAGDAGLAMAELRRAGISCVHERVEDEESFRGKLCSFDPDIILSDYRMPGFDGLAALRIRNTLKREVPFIFVSGTMGEERAVDAVLEGATDYVLKNGLSRFIPAFERALRESDERAQRRHAEGLLRDQAKVQQLVASLSTRFVDVSATALDSELQASLAKIGEFVRADRCFLFLVSEDGNVLNRKEEWHAEGIDRLPAEYDTFVASGSPWLFERLRKGVPVRIASGTAGVRLIETGLASLVAVPMIVDGAMTGFVGFSPQGEKDESESVALLRIAGEIFGGAVRRRNSDEGLRHEKEFVARILDTTASLIIVLDADGHFVRVNPAFSQTTGYSVEQLSGRRVWEVGSPDGEQRLRQAFASILDGSLESYEGLLLTRERDERRIIWQATSIGAGDERFVVATGVDVTERARAEEARARVESKLEQTTRLDALGRLAATITHEFNNVLMGIKPFARVLERRWPDDKGIVEVASQIAKSVLRGERITREILRFTRPAETTLVKVDLKEWLTTFITETQTELTGLIKLQLELCSEPVVIDADPTPLHQALINLVLNARDAMTEGGSVFISLHHAVAAGFETGDKQSFVQLSVRDTGKGIPAEILPHIFEPLFTTRKSGTGLGLAVTYQIIAAHHGHIFAESEVGQGTTFHLFFPLHDDKAVADGPRSEMRLDMSTG